MRKLVPALVSILSCYPVCAQVMRGKVVMADGGIPPQKAVIERVCPPAKPFQEAVASKSGEYLWRVGVDTTSLKVAAIGLNKKVPLLCYLQARIPGFESGRIDIQDPVVLNRPELPPLVLRPAENSSQPDPPKMTRAALKSWDLGTKAVTAQKWSEAERHLRDVLRDAPNFSLAWSGLAYALESQQKPAEARDAYQKAIAADVTALLPRVQLTRLQTAAKMWPEASATAEALIPLDKEHRYLEVLLNHGLASYMLKNAEKAKASLEQVIKLDTKRQMPQAEYLLGATLAAIGDREAAIKHLSFYLEIAPEVPNSTYVREQIVRLSKPPVITAARPVETQITVPDELLPPETEPMVVATGEGRVPGGRKALPAAARLPKVPEPSRFFPEYCLAVATETHALTSNRVPSYVANLEAFLEAAGELAEMGTRQGDVTRIILTTAPAGLPRTRRALELLGWRMVLDKDGLPTPEPGDRAVDAPRLGVARALGIDEFAMRDALASGREFTIEVVTENLPLSGGAAWGVLLQSLPPMPGGIAQGFVRQPRMARTCAALSRLEPPVALALARRVGLRSLVNLHADGMFLHGDAFRTSGGRVVVPGGAPAEAAWAKMAGAPVGDAAAFFEGVLKADRGRLAPFYAAVARGDAAHQAWFTKDPVRLQRFHDWFQAVRPLPEWRARVFQDLPLAADGTVIYPGGRSAWTQIVTDDDAIAPVDRVGGLRFIRSSPPADLEALLAVARLERDRGRAMEPESASLLARHFGAWRDLFPWFAALPGLGPTEFQALAALTETANAAAPAPQHRLAAEWHPMAALLLLGRRSGALDDAAAARAFGDLCRTLSKPHAPAAAFAWLRALSGSGTNLDEAVANRLLRLTGPARAGFDRVRELQHAPRLQTGDPTALPAAAYAALLPANGLLVNEDPKLLSRHVWVGPNGFFSAASLTRAKGAEGSHFSGGFVGFEAIARTLASGGHTATVAEAASSGNGSSPETLFRADARLVEVHTTVTGEKGQYLDGLAAERFTIRENGNPVSVAAFEPANAPISCALVLDTSESMDNALPALKSAASRLIGGLRQDDWVAVYSLSDNLSELASFSTDHDAAGRAVQRAETGGETALYDALIRVNRDLSRRTGKKVIVVFTDGDDNASTLTAGNAILRARTAGIPIYTIAQGNALNHPALLKEMAGMAHATGGLAFTIAAPEQISGVFQSILQDLLHGYLLAFRPPSVEDHVWRRIDVLVRGVPGNTVRAREGYYPE